MKKPRFVLDSFALLAYLQDKDGADRAKDILALAASGKASIHLSWLNLGEIAYVVERRYGVTQCQETLAKIRGFPVILEAVTPERVLDAARVKADHPVSYADAFAIALARELGATIVTGDPEFRQVESQVRVLWL